MNPSTPAASPSRWTERLLRSRWIDGPALNFFLEELNPRWSLVETRARVLEVIAETHDTKSFVLSPGWGWRQFIPGQHIGVCMDIDGVQYRRRYSISSATVSRRREPITITVKREPGGKVSNHLHDHIGRGDILSLALPDGDFVLPKQRPHRLLLLAAGSGITPIMGQLRALLGEGYDGDIHMLHYVRSAQDRIFADDLEALQRRHAMLKVHWCLESGPAADGRFSPEQLDRLVPDHDARHTMLCGPADFMAAVRAHYEARALQDQLQFEYFGSAPLLTRTPDQDQDSHALTLQHSRRQIQARSGQSLLEVLEQAGEQPSYGCRQGICHSCRCLKRSGEVRNLLTGEISREPEEEIQLCISAAESPLSLDY